MPEVRYRRAVSSDLKNLFLIEQASYPQPWTVKQFSEELESDLGFVELLEFDGQLAGFCCCRLLVDTLEVVNIAISPEWRGRGLGRKLLSRVLRGARSQGLLQVWLEVRAGNRAAIALYRSLGFAANGCRPKYYRDGEDALLFRCLIDPDSNGTML